jgi:cytochrome P450
VPFIIFEHNQMSERRKYKRPPGPRPAYPLAHLFSYQRDSIGFLKKLAAEYGDIAHFSIGPISIVLLNHPDLIREVLTVRHRSFVKGRPLQMAKAVLGDGLLTSEGEHHKRQSRIMQPAFHRNMIESYTAAMTRCAARMMEVWEDGKVVDMKEEMTHMSISVAGATLFGADLEAEAPQINRDLEAVTDLFGRISLPFSELLLRLPLPGTLRFKRAKAGIDRVVSRMIADRRRSKEDNGDLMSLLLRAQTENKEGPGMSDKQLHDEVVTLLLTAFDTTSTALTWTWYLLSQHPDAEAELRAEADRVLQGRMPTAADIDQLRFARMVFGESLRLFPPSYLIPRQTVEDFQVGDYLLPPGTIVLLSPYLIQRDPRFHPEPDKFNPHAWESHIHGINAKYEYFPFSRGPRACIGEPFAWLMGVSVLSSVIQHWHVEKANDQPLELLPRINLQPRNGMLMRLHRRK